MKWPLTQAATPSCLSQPSLLLPDVSVQLNCTHFVSSLQAKRLLIALDCASVIVCRRSAPTWGISMLHLEYSMEVRVAIPSPLVIQAGLQNLMLQKHRLHCGLSKPAGSPGASPRFHD